MLEVTFLTIVHEFTIKPTMANCSNAKGINWYIRFSIRTKLINQLDPKNLQSLSISAIESLVFSICAVSALLKRTFLWLSVIDCAGCMFRLSCVSGLSLARVPSLVLASYDEALHADPLWHFHFLQWPPVMPPQNQ